MTSALKKNKLLNFYTMNILPHQIVLENLKMVLLKIDANSFIQKNKMLSGGSIGEHFRHIVEFYQCCLSQKDSDEINYDLRPRNKCLEENLSLGIQTIDSILDTLKKLNDKEPRILKLATSNERLSELSGEIKTSLLRELVYCMDHCIHHQSLIKIALIEQNLIHFVDSSFGVAFSTQKYRKQCAS
jgi:hypothetical protein